MFHQGASVETIKKISEYCFKFYQNSVDKVNEGCGPSAATTLPMYKIGNAQKCSNYRSISLLVVASKVHEIILEWKLERVIEKTLDDKQCCFRPGRGTTDLTLSVKQLSEKVLQYNKLLLCFVEL